MFHGDAMHPVIIKIGLIQINTRIRRNNEIVFRLGHDNLLTPFIYAIKQYFAILFLKPVVNLSQNCKNLTILLCKSLLTWYILSLMEETTTTETKSAKRALARFILKNKEEAKESE